MTHQHVSRTNQQSKSDTPLASGILQRAAVRNVPEKDVQPIEEEATTLRESRFHHNFSQVPASTGEMPRIQPKLRISAVGDRYEQETDRIARDVVQQNGGAVQRSPLLLQSLQQHPATETQSKSGGGYPIQTKGEITENRQISLEASRSNPTSLPDSLKTGIENLSGYSMDAVKVYYNSTKPAQLQAHAFAQGTNIHIASGQEKHLPHEAWHVVQQLQGRVQSTKQSMGSEINDDPELEQEADELGKRAARAPLAGVRRTTIEGVSDARSNSIQMSRDGEGGRVAPVQRVVSVKDESNGKVRGYPNTDKYKKQLSPPQRERFIDMRERQQKNFEFADVNDLHAHLLSNGASNKPNVSLLLREDLKHGFSDLDQGKDQAYGSSGSSKYLSSTRPDMNNWTQYVVLHKNHALSLIPVDSIHDDARTAIDKLYQQALTYSNQLDNHEDKDTLETVIMSFPEWLELYNLSGAMYGVSELAGPLKLKEAIKGMYDQVKSATGSLLRPGPSIVVPRFGAVNSSNMGTWAFIEFNRYDSFPEGSGAAGAYTKLPWEGELSKRRTPDNQNTYIRGHLLNDHLGGPASGFNLVPLVGTDVVGAPNSNAAHSSLVEGQARAAFRDLQGEGQDGSSSPMMPMYSGLRYMVRVSDFGGHDVKGIVREHELTKLRLQLLLSMAEKELGKASGAFTFGEFKNWLGQGSPDPKLQTRYAKEWTNGSKAFVRTVWNTDDNSSLVQDALKRMDENIALWEREATILPKSLVYSFEMLNYLGQPVKDSGANKAVPAGPVLNPMMRYA